MGIAGAFMRQAITIRRDHLSHTEAGKGDTVIKGLQGKATVSWGIKSSKSTLISPTAGLIWQSVSRNAYSEDRGAEFPARYGKMANKELSFNAGININHQANRYLIFNGKIGTNINISRNRKEFTGNIDYIGAYAYDSGQHHAVKPYVKAGADINITKNSLISINAGWQETDYRKYSMQTSLSYSYHW